MKIHHAFIASLCFILLTSHSALAQEASSAEPAWQELKRPGNGKGLFLDPKLLGVGSRVHMVWSGTNDQIRNPEVFHSFSDGKSGKWRSPRAPFFGQNKGKVRKVALGRTRGLIGILFQRSLRQGNDAYEVLLSLSGDQG